jgi:type VI secretion system protein ImpH
VSWLSEIEQEPWRFDFYTVLRRLERSYPNKPRIGDSATRRDDYALMAQDPYMDFPASNLMKFEQRGPDQFRIFVKFLGLLGPQGALPLATTEEAYAWLRARDDAFPRFLDILNHRFLQLFFRAWSDANPVGQHDRPREDRFRDYVGSMIGIGTSVHRDLDCVPDAAKAAYAGLMAPKAKSASRLRGLIQGVLGVKCEIEEFVGVWLNLDKADHSRLGAAQGRLGADMMAGGSFYSLEDKIRIRIYVADMAEYRLFLPGEYRCDELTDLVFFYLGPEIDWEVELAIPTACVEPFKLGEAGALGYSGWMSPNWATDEPYRCDASFFPAERRRPALAADSQPAAIYNNGG